MKSLLKIVIFLLFLASFTNINGQNKSNTSGLTFDKSIHNFGKISINSGQQHCSFKFKNDTQKPIVIYNVISSCGCTTPTWPKKPIMPGETGEIKVVYLNDQGAIPFDKILTVYTSESKKPLVLRIKGIVFEKEKTFKDLFPTAIGPLGVRTKITRVGQIFQGESKEGFLTIANLSNKSVKVDFQPITPGLKLSITPNTIPANNTAEITYTIDTKIKEYWGNNIFKTNVICNGVKAKEELWLEAMILDNFRNLSQEEKRNGSMIKAENSSYNFGTIKEGEAISANFKLKNTGNSNLIIHKIDSTGDVNIDAPKMVKAGEIFNVKVTANTKGYKGEDVITLTLVTNSPLRPLVSLFLVGTIN